MKKFMKFGVIIALVLIVFGFMLAATAQYIHGGPVSLQDIARMVGHGEYDELAHIAHTGDWGEHIPGGLDFVGQAYYDINDKTIFDDDHDIWDGDLERREVAESQNICRMEIELGGCTMSIEPSDDGSCYIEAENARKFQCYVEDGTLHIKSVSSANIWSDIQDRHIILYMPQGATLENVEVDLGAGILELGDLSADRVSLEVGAGQITGDAVIVRDKLEIKVGAGSVDICEIQADKLDVSVSAGSLNLGGDIASKAEISCAMGSIELELAGAESDYNYEIRGSMGSVSIGGREYSAMVGGQNIKNGADKDIRVECSMGNIQIGFGK